MFIPYKDENPTGRSAVVTFLLILANCAAFAFQVFSPEGFEAVTARYAFYPASLGEGTGGPLTVAAGSLLSLVSYMFCHGGLTHIGFNMLFLWIFGNNVEDRMTRGGYFLFYLITGVVAALAFAVQSPGADVPLVGASGAVSGVLGAYLFMFPLARIHVWMLFFTMRMRAFLFLPIWFLLQVSGLFGGADSVAWISHIAGFVAGALLFKLFTVD
ncbi:MAG: rhomboid family intramembrane serine protease [Spirochaetales bacterium]|nr:MAG: rhomboid family intramembrane serine protease [Spirochaetales bacterium]